MKRPLLLAGLAFAGLALAGLAVTHGLSDAGVTSDPPAAVVSNAWALLGKPSTQNYTAAEKLARQALDRNPMQASAVSLLGALNEQRGDKARGAQLMAAAAGLSRRDDIADYWLFNHYMDSRDYDKAMLHADALLRRKYRTLEQNVYPRILVNVRDPAMASALANRLARNPEWRMYFLPYAAQRFTDPFGAFVIFTALDAAGSPPTSAELRPFLTRLLAEKQYEKAYLAWVRFLPQAMISRVENVFDGGFNGWPDTRPFGWDFGPGIRGSVESAEAYGGNGSALRVDFDGLVLPKFPRQILILPPGDYRFSGKVLTATTESAGRVEWRISCDNAPSILPSLPAPNTGSAWKAFAIPFTIPDGCLGQWLELKPIAADHRVAVEVWYDDLAVERVSDAG